MSKTIYKYQLTPLHTVLDLPKGAEILCIKTQRGSPYLWALVDDEKPTEHRRLVIFETGHQVVNAGKYVDTFLIENDSLVFHVFEGLSNGQR